MDIKDKKVIVFGLGVTGKSSIRALSKLGAKVYIYDDRKYEEYKDTLNDLKEYDYQIIENKDEIEWEEIEFILKSPGIKLDNKFILLALEKNIKVYSDIEVAYQLWGGDNLISVTGTNGKTTTTAMISHILNKCGIKSKVVGNIGVGILWEILQNGLDYKYVLELSSFQLSSIDKFRSKVSIITNITEDHTDWHGKFDNYKESKYAIFKNVLKNDVVILNKDDIYLKNLNINSDNILYFSLKNDADAYLNNNDIVVLDNKFNKDKIHLVGNHNIANTLAACLAISNLYIPFNKIVDSISTFNAIEHRIEFVKEINGVKYFNDSKGTNIDSTKVALDGFESNVILIGGGYDKHVEFDTLFNCNKNIKLLILYGETKYKMEKSAKKCNIKNIEIVNDLEQAVNLAYNYAVNGDTVLFSPANASWDMYNSYEERGKHFKELVLKYAK
ncbi:UDP-N-acetylmuramoyl-L-alanine--D-glutamate ligase [Helcococcus ovis]|uniref:UDP-N-acetylmuramoyl-L-alanine--D-glutamate ligase n=1 Tax=Helcococcus ovis TaxID=72026 RepID=UPI0038BA4AC9